MAQNNQLGRRSFLKHTSKTAVILGVAGSVAGSFLIKSCTNKTEVTEDTLVKNHNPFVTGFEQTPLAYSFSALEPHIDAETMEIHYTKHAAAYTKNMNEAIAEENIDSKSVEEILASISKYSTKLRNNAGGHYNHELFWNIMSNTPQSEPSGKLAEAIDNTFTSYSLFKELFEEHAKSRFGSGWAWLIVNDGILELGSTPNQDNPLMDVSELKGVPLFGIDVWEHAYYLKYQNRRPEYLAAWWNVLDWKKIEDRYDKILAANA